MYISALLSIGRFVGSLSFITSVAKEYPKDLPLTNNKTGTSYVKLNMADIGPVQSSQALHFQPDVRRGVAPDARF